MDYQQFKEQVGKLTLPENAPVDLFEGYDSVHFLIPLAVISDGNYRVSISENQMRQFLSVIEILETRGAVRERDYVVCCALGSAVTLGIHTTSKFLSDEDFDGGIMRISTK